VYALAKEYGLGGQIVFVEDYDIRVAKFLVRGVDVWLNNPTPPLEASGTSGQKAALNGVPNLSVADGWWWEGYNGGNGWTIGPTNPLVEIENRPYWKQKSCRCSISVILMTCPAAGFKS
jgi:starch phosphorylase